MTSPAIDFLSSHAFPDLAAAVRAVVASSAVTWERAVRQTLPSADGLTMEQLRDDLPKVLNQAANALESTQRYATNTLADMAPQHGGVRFDQGFKLSELLIEYSILRAVLSQEIVAHLRRNLETQEMLALNAALDVVFAGVVVQYVDVLTNQLKAATEAQSKYLSFLSHDLRGGLNGVFLMIEVLKRELAGEERLAETVEDLDIMRRSLLETVATMDRFLHAERFRKGKVQVRPMRIALKRLLNECASHFAYQAKEKNVELRVDIPDELEIESDKELLLLIFQNLLSNALKYTNSGTRVTIQGECGDAGLCKVSVTDQGPGIAREKLDGLFDPFARGETHGQPGVGLGLSIARQAAQYLTAKLWAESQVGKGSKFIVELPKQIRK